MTATAHETQPHTPTGGSATPYDVVREIASGWVLNRALHFVAGLGVADALDGSPRPAAALEVGLARTRRRSAAHGRGLPAPGHAGDHGAAPPAASRP